MPRERTTNRQVLVNGHCEDYPCCGHEENDCAGQRYGTDEDIKRRARRDMDRFDDYGYIAENDH